MYSWCAVPDTASCRAGVDSLAACSAGPSAQSEAESRRAATLTAVRSRHARFAGVPEEDDSEGSTAAADTRAVEMGRSGSTPALGLAAEPQLAAVAAGNALARGSACPSLARASLPGRPAVGSSGAQRRLTDGSAPSDLLEEEQRSELSGVSSASSGSRLSRLTAHAWRRSRRNDYPPLMGTSLFYFKVGSGSGGEE